MYLKPNKRKNEAPVDADAISEIKEESSSKLLEDPSENEAPEDTTPFIEPKVLDQNIWPDAFLEWIKKFRHELKVSKNSEAEQV